MWYVQAMSPLVCRGSMPQVSPFHSFKPDTSANLAAKKQKRAPTHNGEEYISSFQNGMFSNLEHEIKLTPQLASTIRFAFRPRVSSLANTCDLSRSYPPHPEPPFLPTSKRRSWPRATRPGSKREPSKWGTTARWLVPRAPLRVPQFLSTKNSH